MGRALSVECASHTGRVDHRFMESTSHSLTDAKITNENALIKVKVLRGMSLRACVANAAVWTLVKVHVLPTQEASNNKTS